MTAISALRTLTVLRRLDDRWCRVATLAAEYGVNAKTIRRDLAAIRRAGWRVHERIEPRGRKAYRLRRPGRRK